eukprot:TRINITY_DN9475_c0_g1_i1.p1 TRINITY_DN9475_c0_g1~~TRINITY_DN9475_c0_g1_i1.p1  ORF type:complete len:301 (-),score=61.64 TRINITY_DN9475_c0_g1_i1:93-995(-)
MGSIVCRGEKDAQHPETASAEQQSKVVFDCCVLSPNYVDETLFNDWVSGKSASAAHAGVVYGTEQGSSTGLEHELLPMLEDQWLVHQGLEHYLLQPWLLSTQKLHPIYSTGQAAALIEMYYSFNTEVARKLMGWKLEGQKSTARLSWIAKESKSIPESSCFRQFRNFGQVLSTIGTEYKDGSDVSMKELISQKYLLPLKLANSYAMFIFASQHRFELSTDSLSKLDFFDLCKLLSVVTSSWTAPKGGLFFDDQFVQHLIAARNTIERNIYETAVAERFTFDNANRPVSYTHLTLPTKRIV